MGDNLKVTGGIILQAAEYREKEIEIERMQEKGLLPRGDPQDEVIQIFKIRARKIFLNLPKKDDIIHIKFKRVPHPPFPIWLPSHSSLPSKMMLKLCVCPGVCNSPPSQLRRLSTCGYVLRLTFTWEDRAQMSDADQKQSLFWMMVTGIANLPYF